LTTYLPDINILIGLAREDVESHAIAFRWFHNTGIHRFATCAFSQAGFVRICSNERISPRTVTVSGAMEMLDGLTSLSGHQFWSLDTGLAETIRPFRSQIYGHGQITDAYLLGLAIQNNGVLVTRDKAIAHLAGKTWNNHLLIL
jgi:uncharacterized protein